jgi:hypothetical protein
MVLAKRAKTARGRKQDRARVAGGQDYDVQYRAEIDPWLIESRPSQEMGLKGYGRPTTLSSSKDRSGQTYCSRLG